LKLHPRIRTQTRRRNTQRQRREFSDNQKELLRTLWRRGATNKNQRVTMGKASSIFACSQKGCRRQLHFGRAAFISCERAVSIYRFPARGISRRLNAQLPLPIPSSAVSPCEQAFSRELLLPLTRDTVLAAVPWLRSSAKARH